MLWLADAGLAAAVSNAGALGVISPLAGSEPHGDAVKNLSMQIDRVQSLTKKPFGVNLPLDLRDIDLIINLLLEKNVAIVVTAAGDPDLFTELLKSSGIKVLHVVSCVKHAVKAEQAGVDAVIAEGVEAAARNGTDELPLFSLIPQVADKVNIPVIAAGGIVDARGAAAAMLLGAKGVQMGTRFVATKECIAHPDYKNAILKACDTDTIITIRSLIPSRSLKNTEFTKQLIELEKAGAAKEELRSFMGHAASRTAGLLGDIEHGEAYCGSSAGMINEILPAGEVIRRIVNDWETAIKSIY
jgi:enoyl-[acyl-carrier protein] reductase II